MGLHTVRMSRKNHSTGKMKVPQVDISGLRGTGTRNGSVLRTKDTPSDPTNKHRPFDSSKGGFPPAPQWTPPPKPMEDVNHGIEGSGGKRQRKNNRI